MRLEGGSIGIAPHSLRAVAPEELSALLAFLPTGPVHIHAAEQVREVEACVAWSGKRPVEWLIANVALDRRWCLIHATHMTDAETDALAASGATVGLCPITEANLGDGLFNGRRFLRSGGHFGIGTDANVLIDVAAELRQLEYAQRLRDRARNRLDGDDKSTARTIFVEAVEGGARALGCSPAGIVAGASADIVSLDPDHIILEGRRGDRILDAWIFAARQSAIDSVWVPRGEAGFRRAALPPRRNPRRLQRRYAQSARCLTWLGLRWTDPRQRRSGPPKAGSALTPRSNSVTGGRWRKLFAAEVYKPAICRSSAIALSIPPASLSQA